MNTKSAKRILFVAITALAAMQAVSAPIDVTTAQATAQRYAASHATIRPKHAPASAQVRLVHTERGTTGAGDALYYIFNTSDSYLIVSGDDRAREILAHGDAPLDMNNIPCNMRVWLELYQGQMAYLLSHPDLSVESNVGGPRRVSSQGYESVEPLLTALWDQGEPYNRECPEVNGHHSVTGCAATSTAMVFYYWKYPTGPTSSVPSYTTQTHNISLETLPSTTFDWDNMLDRYYHGGYNDDQANAVAKLMRYVGQSEHMDYSPDGSGASSYRILSTIKRFGYDSDVELVSKEDWWSGVNYSDEEWGAIIQEELVNQRPIVMCAYTATWSGHAFNIDGYDASDDTYHINWGWSGTGNAYYALNAFKGGGEYFNVDQQLLIGIDPPASGPTIKAGLSRLTARAYVDSTAYKAINVKGVKLTSDISVTLDDATGYFTLSTDHISQTAAQQGQHLIITYSPTAIGMHTATITLRSEGADDKVIHLTGECLLETYDPVMLAPADITPSSFRAEWQDATPRHNVSSYNLEVARVPYNELRLHESFDKSEYSGTSTTDWASKLDEITTLPGWSGSKVYRSDTNVILGTSKSKGWIETPALDMYGNHGKATIKVIAHSSGNDASAPLKISCGDHDTTIVVSNEETEQCLLLPCPATGEAHIRLTTATGKRVVLCQVEVFAGDDYTPVDLTHALYVEGITDTSFTLNDMQPGDYGLRVQTAYTDGTLSPWSNRMRVLIDWERGDVNHDGEINISDVSEVVNVLLLGIDTPSAIAITDVNGDGEINIADVNMVIDKILKGE